MHDPSDVFFQSFLGNLIVWGEERTSFSINNPFRKVLANCPWLGAQINYMSDLEREPAVLSAVDISW